MSNVTSDGKRKDSVSNWEEIVVGPRIDLIPDEFNRETNANVLVELICDKDEKDEPSAYSFKNLLCSLGYQVNVTDRDREKMQKTMNEDWLNRVLQKTKEKNYDGLIMIFVSVTYNNEVMKRVWSSFTTQHCPSLKNKPKIFIFQIAKRSVDRDSTATALNWAASYETPAEADLLIIQDKEDENSHNDFFDTLTENITNYKLQEDLLSLITIGSAIDYSPMVISTMTRKFYLVPHSNRGHHHNLLNKLDQIKKYIEKHHNGNKKVKKRMSFRNVFDKVLSPKGEERANNKQMDDNNSKHDDKVKVGKGKTVTKARSRTSSICNSNSSLASTDSNKKPPWRP